MLAVCACVLVSVLPLLFESPLSRPALDAWQPLHRIYLLLKPAVLWAGLGLLCGLARQGVAVRKAALSVAALSLLCLPLVANRVVVGDLVEVMAVLPGLALGLWLGERSVYAAGADQAGLAPDGPFAPLAHSDGPTGAERRGGVRASRARDALLALALLVLAGWLAWDFPRWNVLLGAGLAAYSALLWRYPDAWLFVVPAALPVLDLAFWTGRFFFDEFDALMLVTVAAWLLQRNDARRGGALPAAAWCLALSVLLSTVVALVPWPSLDANAFSSYWSPFNALRVAKGFVWGGALYLMARPAIRAGRVGFLAAGMTAGLLAASGAALWESWLFTGFASGSDYRVTGTFSSMHTGGGHIEAYLAAALPFAWLLLSVDRRPWVRAIAVAAVLLAGYAILTTVARGGLLAFLAVVFVLAASSIHSGARHFAAPGRAVTALGALGAGTLIVAIGVSGGGFLQQRIAATATDAGIRAAHWAGVMRAMDGSVRSWLLGEGLGSFPRRYLFAHTDQPLGTYWIGEEQGNRYLGLNSGGTLYMAQSVRVAPGSPYTVELDARSDGRARSLEISLCEKKLFNSHACQWGGGALASGSRDWQHLKWSFDSGEVGRGNWLTRRPVQLSLYNPAERSTVDIDNVRLLDGAGHDLLLNGDFSRGLDNWFFKSGDHLPWHVKNLWIHTLFEQGVLGLLALGVLVLVAAVRLARGAWNGDALAAALLASLAAFLVIGTVDSMVDAPRLGALLVFVMLCGSASARLDDGDTQLEALNRSVGPRIRRFAQVASSSIG